MEFLVVHDEYERGEREKRATARELDITDAIPQIEFLARTLRAATGDTKEEGNIGKLVGACSKR